MLRLPVQSPPILHRNPRIVILKNEDGLVHPQQVQGVARNYVNHDSEHCFKWCAARGGSEYECLDRCKHAY